MNPIFLKNYAMEGYTLFWIIVPASVFMTLNFTTLHSMSIKYLQLENIFFLLLKYKYLILFPLAIVEGPILAVIAGFLSMGGFLNVFIVYPIIVLGDIIGDTVCYMFGRWGVPGFLKRIIKRLGLKPENMDRVRVYFDSNPKKTVSLSKITLGIGFAGIYLAGNARIPYLRFIRICLITSALQYVVYLNIGLLFGSAYKQISNYLNFFAAFALVTLLSIILFYIVKSIRKKIMRILFVSSSYYPHINGVYYFVCRIGPLLQERGHKVAVIAPSESVHFSHKEIDNLDVYGVPSLSVIINPSIRIPIPFLLKSRIKRIIGSFKPDIIHIQDHFPLSKAVVQVNKNLKIPIIGSNHFMPENFTILLQNENLKKRLENFLWKGFSKVFNQVNLVTTPTETGARLIRPRLKVDAIAISSGISLEIFNPSGDTREIKKNISSLINPYCCMWADLTRKNILKRYFKLWL